MSNNIDQAKLYYKSIAGRMSSYTEPLKHLGITNFGYGKIYSDRYLHVSNNHNLILEYIDNISDIYAHEAIAGIINTEKNEIQSTGYYSNENSQYISNTIFSKYACSNGIIMSKFHGHYVEIWWFSRNKDHPIPRIQKHNHDLLKKFILYFNTKATDIITTDASNMRLLEKPFDLFNTDATPADLSSAEKFLQALNLKRAVISTREDTFRMSTREIECLKFLSQAYSAKNIASILDISQKTVEAHFYNIRRKTFCKSKEELALLYRTHLA